MDRLGSPIALFLGAGATAPLGKPLMGEFVKKLEGDSEIGPSYLFSEIAGQNADLEFILEELGDLENKAYISQNPTYFSSAPPIRARGLEASVRDVFMSQVAAIASQLRAQIENRVFYAYRSFDSPSDVVEAHFAPLFDALLRSTPPSDPLLVFTTNYDPGVELYCQQNAKRISLNDGFRLNLITGQPEWDPNAFDANQVGVSNDMRQVWLLKLHGSTNWFRSGQTIIRGIGILAPQDPMYTNLLIYPAQRKVAISEPFFTAYCALQRTLESARLLVAVGYSFRDQDALTRLMAAQRVNRSLRVALIDPSAEQIAKLLDQRGINQILPIPYRYDPRGSQFKDFMLRLEAVL